MKIRDEDGFCQHLSKTYHLFAETMAKKYLELGLFEKNVTEQQAIEAFGWVLKFATSNFVAAAEKDRYSTYPQIALNLIRELDTDLIEEVGEEDKKDDKFGKANVVVLEVSNPDSIRKNFPSPGEFGCRFMDKLGLDEALRKKYLASFCYTLEENKSQNLKQVRFFLKIALFLIGH